MAGKTGNNLPRTVILATDVCSYSIPVVNLAAEIAASSNSKLQGIFIEDEDLLVLTGSPLTREISLTTASARPTSIDRMQRMLRSVARQFETTLQREAQASKIAWSYEYVRGRVQDISLKPRLDAAFTILGRTGLHRVEPGQQGRTRKVLVISNHSAQQLQALAVVLRRFARDRIELTIVGESGDLEFRQALRPVLEDLQVEVALLEIDREGMFARLRKVGSAYDCAILSMHEKVDDLAAVLEALQCPVILVA